MQPAERGGKKKNLKKERQRNKKGKKVEYKPQIAEGVNGNKFSNRQKRLL
jgi:hypothetical protein